MFWFNMGPRGRKFGHRGFRPEIFAGIIALMFGGWIILAVLGGLLGASIMILGPVFSSLAHFVSDIFSGIFSAESVAVGVVIGLIWAFRNRKRKADGASESAADDTASDEETEAEIIETQSYRFNG